jgi:hypothetical protein
MSVSATPANIHDIADDVVQSMRANNVQTIPEGEFYGAAFGTCVDVVACRAELKEL